MVMRSGAGLARMIFTVFFAGVRVFGSRSFAELAACKALARSKTIHSLLQAQQSL